MRIGIKSLHDFLGLVIRRKWWVLTPFVILACLVAVLTKELPRIYVSDALIVIRPRDVPDAFVLDLISGSTSQRLRSIEQTILSRKNLVAILQEFETSLPEFRRLNRDEAIARLRKDIDVNFDIIKDARGTTDVTSFTVSYQHKNPEVAQKIASRLTTLFLEQDSRNREEQVHGTNEFLTSALDVAEADLKASDERVKALKSAYPNELPEQLDSNQRALDQLSLQRQANEAAIARTQTQKSSLEQILADTPEFLPPTPVAQIAPTPSAETNPKVEEYLRAKEQYERLDAVYGAPYPDTINAKALMESLRRRVTDEELEAAEKAKVRVAVAAPEQSKPELNKTYQSLSAQLQAANTELRLLRGEKEQIAADIAKYRQRVDNTPQVELQLAEVLRENEDLQKRYNDLNEKLTQAQLSKDLETNQRGSQFLVVDPANYPIEPSKPNKVLVLVVGLLLSLAISMAVAFGIDVTKQRVWTQSEIETFWGVPVMVDIPSIVTDEDLVAVQRKNRTFVLTAVVASALYGIALYVIYLNANPILQGLEPVLQGLVYR